MMSAKKSIPRVTSALFTSEPLICGTCGELEATHEIHIRVQRGLDYSQSKQLYSVTYAVCGVCAQELVTVNLSAKLGTK